MNKELLIGSYYKVDYKLSYSKPIILFIYDDTFVLSDSGTTYEWALLSNNRISIYIENSISLIGIINGNRIIDGKAFSPLSGLYWEWEASAYIPPKEPTLMNFKKAELLNGEWTIFNNNDLPDNVIKFLHSGRISSKRYGEGTWELNELNELLISTANYFITYSFKIIDGKIVGSAKNEISESWEASLKHSFVEVIKDVKLIPETQSQFCDIAKKNDAVHIRSFLNEMGITHFYHFTDYLNLDSINERGLLSWFYCEQNNVVISSPGGDSFSRNLDRQFKLHDYVRLSFCPEHPMLFCWKRRNNIKKVKILHISTEVATIKETLFSDINAADKQHKLGGGIDFLRTLKFDIFNKDYRDLSVENKKKYQAEILVKTCIPTKYILNL